MNYKGYSIEKTLELQHRLTVSRSSPPKHAFLIKRKGKYVCVALLQKHAKRLIDNVLSRRTR